MVSEDIKTLAKLLFAGLAWAALIAYTREFIISQLFKRDTWTALTANWLSGVQFHQGEPAFFALYLCLFLLAVLAIVASLMANFLGGILYVVGMIIYVSVDYIYLQQTYALILGILACVAAAAFALTHAKGGK